MNGVLCTVYCVLILSADAEIVGLAMVPIVQS